MGRMLIPRRQRAEVSCLSPGSEHDPTVCGAQGVAAARAATRLPRCACQKGHGGMLGSACVPSRLLVLCGVPPQMHGLLRDCSWGFIKHREENELPSLP